MRTASASANEPIKRARTKATDDNDNEDATRMLETGKTRSGLAATHE